MPERKVNCNHTVKTASSSYGASLNLGIIFLIINVSFFLLLTCLLIFALRTREKPEAEEWDIPTS